VIHLIQETHDAGCRTKKACEMLGIDIRTLQRWQKGNNHEDKRHGSHTQPANKLTDIERSRILQVANSPEYCNQSPSQIVPNLADQEIYIASESSFYRVLKQADQLKHRHLSQPKTHKKPDELVALKPNQVWSWDISYLPTKIAGVFFYLYLFLDIFSRKIVGASVFEKESAEYAAEVIAKAYLSEGIQKEKITLHSDNGSPMKGCTMLVMLQKLGVVPSFSRPSVSNDNPYSESMFRTLKYCPQYPSQPFFSIEEARAWVLKFVDWYNTVHQHSGINFVTPQSRHQGLDKAILEKRARVYETARQKNPNRWSKKIRNWAMVEQVFLNPKHSQKKAA
jgi:putative transposase